MAKKTHWTLMKYKPGFRHQIRYYSHAMQTIREFRSKEVRDEFIKEQEALISACKNDAEYVSLYKSIQVLQG